MLLSVGFDFILDFLMTPIRHGDIFVTIVVYFYTTWFCFLSSLFFVTLVSLERYLVICHPIKHHLLKGTKRTVKLICIVFVGSFVFMSVTFSPFSWSYSHLYRMAIRWQIHQRLSKISKTLFSRWFLFGHCWRSNNTDYWNGWCCADYICIDS